MLFEMPPRDKPPRSVRTVVTVVAIAVTCTLFLVLRMPSTKTQMDRVPYKHRLTDE